MDADLDNMTPEQLKAEVVKLRAGIREHRDAQGHELCWYQPELWGLLPEKVKVTPTVPPRDEFLHQCSLFRDSLGKPPEDKTQVTFEVHGVTFQISPQEARRLSAGLKIRADNADPPENPWSL